MNAGVRPLQNVRYKPQLLMLPGRMRPTQSKHNVLSSKITLETIFFPAHACRNFYVVLAVCDRQGWTHPALTRHGDGRRVPARAFPPVQVPVLPSGRLS
jgi:hypothetical protein